MDTEPAIPFQRRLEALIQTSPLAVIEWDSQHRITTWAGTAQEMFGWPASEVLGKRADEWRFVPEDDWDVVRQAETTMESGQACVNRNRNYRKDGAVIHCEWYNSVLTDPNGAFQSGLSLVLDVTERKKMEAEVRHREEFAHLLLDTSPAFIVAIGHKGQVLTMNQALLDTLEYTMAEAVGKDYLTTFVAEEDRAGLIAVFQRLVESRQHQTAINWIVSKSGKRFLVEWHAGPAIGGGDKIELFIGVGIDITERTRIEEALRASEERYRKIVDHAPIGIFRSTVEGRFLTMNAKGAAMFGFASPEEMTSSITDIANTIFTRPEQRCAIVERAIAAGDFVSAEVEYRRTDGTTFQANLYMRAVRDESDRLSCVEGFVEDVTNRRLAEEALRRSHEELEQRVSQRTAELSAANERLQELDRLKSQFLASMSHELRTPMNSIIGFTSLLRQGLTGPVNAEQKHQLEIVQSSARHLLTLINDLLDVSRIESGRADIELAPFRFEEVLQEAVHTVQPLADRKNIPIVVDCEPSQIPMVGDRKRNFQILLNLINNAVKFTGEGSVTIRARVVGHDLSVSVRDTGIGIKAEHLGMLFEAFRQVDGSAKKVYEGTGLGLYLCRKLLGLMGGSIQAQSSYGAGSTFSYSLPLELPANHRSEGLL
jgi:PAS domain S-box-containing protein